MSERNLTHRLLAEGFWVIIKADFGLVAAFPCEHLAKEFQRQCENSQLIEPTDKNKLFRQKLYEGFLGADRGGIEG